MMRLISLLLLLMSGVAVSEETTQSSDSTDATPDFATPVEHERYMSRGNFATPLGKHTYLIPYPYYNQITGATAGITAIASGYLQPQVTAFANFIISDNGSKIGYFQLENLQLFGRFFFDTKILYGEWGAVDVYIDRSNNSNEDDFVEIEADDQWYRLGFEFLLPIGDGKDTIVDRYRIQGSRVTPETASGGHGWSPLDSGRTYLRLEPFYRKEELDTLGTFVTSGLTTAIDYDNRDWPVNPGRGNRVYLEYKRDWGNLKDSVEWTAIQGSYSQYFPLGASDWFEQQVLAFDLWSLYIPTWDDTEIIDGEPRNKRPPPFAGTSLGGWDRFRGYPANRFEDKAGIDYQLEYRMVPRWNPFPKIPLIKRLDIPFWQLAVFGELGRVAPEWSIDELHSDMRWNLGVGARAFVNGMLVRIDVAGSEEGAEVQMIVDQPF
ncbi:MAG: BamA/TamA family outer membrane protein [Pseudomonadota bacterium]